MSYHFRRRLNDHCSFVILLENCWAQNFITILSSGFCLAPTRAPAEIQEGICPFLSTTPHSSLLDLSRHHYRFILSVAAEGNIAKKGSIPSESGFPHTFEDILSCGHSPRQNEKDAATEGQESHCRKILGRRTRGKILL